MTVRLYEDKDGHLHLMQMGDTFFYSFVEQGLADGNRFENDARTLGFWGGNWQDRTNRQDAVSHDHLFVHLATWADGVVTLEPEVADMGNNARDYLAK